MNQTERKALATALRALETLLCQLCSRCAPFEALAQECSDAADALETQAHEQQADYDLGFDIGQDVPDEQGRLDL